ncbi:phosphate acetyltransferase [candidate division WOR-1 bacterium RIFOXYA2_FULL_36_21]|uniref:Phosphate acetyltransferase n=1 Tax=candidate division WOR-1 bacterium RIFOXYB2_FULL_36_35 TaxID=1802578 RepID=A0A1F4S5S1_UNCSA|nr:MAG: phosphate acetyltransferase [candidate division WOR-1 bacterium RIFOXYA2_FULL_36_21]OGC15772.1 MAG: phosphate acetyltransferase [candidate division WOR-1 bacterium RIFOXYB2_FULL_36_35]OGC18969.1 MAG: phosphate acetyltransferase [candidate division WOR-1 bacterium RIFOXYA12_FULL_36_13]
MDFIQDIWNKAKRSTKKIALPESEDIRILKASELITKSRLAKIILIGDENKIKENAAANNIDLTGIEFIVPANYPRIKEFARKFQIKLEKKGMTEEKAYEILTTDYPFFAGMLVDCGEADGMVSGANHPTSHTIKAAIQCVGTKENSSIISSFFVMLLQNKEFGEEGLLFYADCGVMPNPTSQELAQIAIQTAESFSKLIGTTPQVAMLSFSTMGSANHPDVDKVTNATQIAKKMNEDLLIDGPLQADAALIKSIANKKSPESPVAGTANVLIFPDLDAGNISYKLTQRLAGAVALGPIFQGTKKPVNDLSRGCSVEDIINITVITAIQAL